MHPAVSIIMPAYNQEKYLKEALDSVRRQKFDDYECIIIDDGSTDGTSGIAEKYLEDKRFKYFYQQNKGLAGARNSGISLAGGKYLHFLDSDDVVFEDFFKLMVEKLENNPDTDILNCAWILIDESGKKISGKIGPVQSNDYFSELLFQNLFPVNSLVMKSSILKKEKPFNERLSALEDWELWLRLAYKGYKFGSIDFLGAAYRRHDLAMTRDVERITKSLNTFIEIFYNEHKELSENRKYTYLYQTTNTMLYAEEAGKAKDVQKTGKEILAQLDDIKYKDDFFKRYYGPVRNIKNRRIKFAILDKIILMSPACSKRYWNLKKIKNVFKI